MMGCNFVLTLDSDPPTIYFWKTTDMWLCLSLLVVLAAFQLGLLSLQFRQRSSWSLDIHPRWQPIYSTLLLTFCFPACLAILSCLLIFNHERVSSICSDAMNSFCSYFSWKKSPLNWSPLGKCSWEMELVSSGKLEWIKIPMKLSDSEAFLL